MTKADGRIAFWRSLRAHLMALVLLASVPMAALVIYNSVEVRGAAVDEAGRLLSAGANVAAEELANRIDGARLLLASLAEAPPARLTDMSACSGLLGNLGQRAPRNMGLSLTVTAPNGEVICSWPKLSGSVNLADRQYFKDALATRETVVGRPVISRISNTGRLPIAQPILDPAGKVTMVVTAAIGLQGLADEFMATRPDNNILFSVWDESMTILFRSVDNDKWFGTVHPDFELDKAFIIPRGTSGMERRGLDGVHRIYGLARSVDYPNLGLIFSLGLSKEALTAPADRAFGNDLLLLGFILIAALGGAWCLGEIAIRRRIAALVHATSRIASGNFDTRVGEKHHGGELGQLAIAFDQMAAAMQKQIGDIHRGEQEIRSINASLEQRITQRTSELSEANSRLIDTTARMEAIFNTVVDGIIIIDERGMVETINPTATKVFGYAPAEVIGRNVSMLIAEPYRSQHDGDFSHYVVAGKTAGIGREILGQRKDGSTFPMDLAVSEMRVSAERRFTAVVRDITERKRAEDAIVLAREEAESANRAKSTFLASMSHEIRTPLNGVIGMIDVLHQTSLQGYQVEMVHLIRESAFSLLGIVEDILDFSKIEAGKLELECAPLSLATVTELVCNMLDHFAARKSVDIRLFTDPAIPAKVLGDNLRVRQVLTNLLNNAIKFSSDGERPGKVSLRARLDEQTPEQVMVEFQVTDNGIGMDEQTQARLFTSFTQADASTTRRFGGTGLGLVICSNLVKLMDGQIAVQSAPAKGTTFTVRLPFVPLAADPDALHAASEVAGLSCLVVGGADGMAEDLAVYLTHGNATVERAPDIASAKERVNTERPATLIIVMDTNGAAIPLDEIRGIVCQSSDVEARFVVIERGRRRKPRLAAADLVRVDGNNLTRATFLRAVAVAAGRAQEQTEPQAPFSRKTEAQIKPPTREEALQQGRLILVAEDNETNQHVITRQLGLLGLAADVVSDGHEALERWRSGDYCLLFTDLHMPKMDGFQLTAAIRGEEKGTRSHIPIVALTANAIKGEADRCRQIGMEGYVTKPATLSDLQDVMAKYLPDAAAASPDALEPSDTRAAPQAAAAPVDVRVLEGLVGKDQAVLNDFLQEFRIGSAKMAVDLKAACQAGHAAEAQALAHKLKSSARSVGALALGDLCAGIEGAGTARDPEALIELLPRFEAEMAAVEHYLDRL